MKLLLNLYHSHLIFKKFYFLLFACLITQVTIAQKANQVRLSNEKVNLVWTKSVDGWRITTFAVKKGSAWLNIKHTSGEYTYLYSKEAPSNHPDTSFKTSLGNVFPEESYKAQQKVWSESINPVSLNTAGQAIFYFPQKIKQDGNDHLFFEYKDSAVEVIAEWSFDKQFPGDIVVKQSMRVKQAGYYSFASPTISTIDTAEMTWAMIPGYFQGNRLQHDFVLAYAYGQGVPILPAVYRERTASTLSPMVTNTSGITFSAIPDPVYCRDPWDSNAFSHSNWNIGLSHKNRRSELSPTLYYPVLGEPQSVLQAADVIHFTHRIALTDGDWYKAMQHTIYDVFKFKDALALRQTKQSLTDRIHKMHAYLTNPKLSLWNIEEYKGMKIGAQSYLGGVIGSNKDAMKNADYGAMWMLAKTSNDSILKRDVLPYALNFKFQQQITDEGFFKGALEGQYYLAKSKQFREEWGEVVEPIAVTYYTMLDLGNILLFEPNALQLKERLRAGADWLIKTQRSNGSWPVAYDKKTGKEEFTDLKDLRPTFYGLLVAYRILKDPKYLISAEKGADWFIKEGVEKGHLLGVCGDARYVADFATAQSAQILLDMYDISKKDRYKVAAIKLARFYTASVYTHPIPDSSVKRVGNVLRKDWEIAQSGLSFEHGGILGSANTLGPIQLASHAGMFVRMFQLTGDTIFIDMARSAAWGRDAFVDPKTSVASYYWKAMNKGAGPYPHHAWWQTGWITDYLMSEAELRSKGSVNFPRGFVTPKVGPHQTYGFKPGTINGIKVNLINDSALIEVDNAAIDYILATSLDGSRRFIVLLNNSMQDCTFSIRIQGRILGKRNIPATGIDIITLTDETRIKN